MTAETKLADAHRILLAALRSAANAIGRIRALHPTWDEEYAVADLAEKKARRAIERAVKALR